jgi:uncharacterized protein YecT (DUF1311 family)
MIIWILIILIFSHSAFSGEELDCEKASTTIAINYCMHKDLVTAEKVMEDYLTMSLKQNAKDTLSISSIEKGQAAWLEYREAHCLAVYNTWREGTIRTAMELDCKLALTYQRTRVLWESFLTYMDSTQPVLPEPKPYKRQE